MKVPNSVLIPEIISALAKGHTVTIELKGFSMRPFLESDRDRILVSRPSHIAKGDIVLAEIQPRHYVLHRIVKINPQEIILRGDGNLHTEHCKLQDIKGKARAFYRKGREKPDLTSGWKWKLYSKIWCTLLPIRRYVLAAYKRVWIPLFGPV